MDDAAWFASSLAFAVSMSATPGPNNTMLTASGANWGFRRTVPHLLGVVVGFPVMIVLVALGAGGLLRARPWLQDGLRWIGVAYLLWLAWKIGTARPALQQNGAARPVGRPLGFARAALFQLVNPKAWVIAVGAVVPYTTATGSALVAQALTLAMMFAVVTLPCCTLWTLTGVGTARLLRTQLALRRFNLALAGLLVASLVPMVFGE